MVVLGFQIFVLLVGLTVWAIKLARRGKALTEVSSQDKPIKSSVEGHKNSEAEDELLTLSKAHISAKLSYDSEKTKETEEMLKAHLVSEFEVISRGQRNVKLCRKLMMLKIRRTLVKNPYDNVGRSMAIETKSIFLKQVLMITNPWDNLGKCFKIPTKILKYKKMVVFLPMLWATLGTLRKGAVYVNDMYSDIQVIHELNMIPTITTPTIPAKNVTNFFFYKYDETGVFGLKDPCDLLDQIEEVGNAMVPFYKSFISEAANVHWNPNRKSDFNLTSFFKISESMGKGFKSKPTTKQQPTNSSKPSRIKDFAEYLLSKAEEGHMKLEGIENSWFAGWFVDSVDDFTALLDEALPRMREMKANVLEANITNTILKKLDAYWENRTTTSYPHIMEVFSFEMIKKLDKNTIKMFEHNTTQYHYLVNLTNSQIFCRDTIRSLFTLKMNTELRQTFERYYLEKGGNRKNNFDKVKEGVNESLKFLTQNIIRSFVYYLVMTIVATLLLEIKTIFLDFYMSNQIPLISNLKLKWHENNPNSPLIKGGENCNNSYIVKASKRHNFNIQEATHETLSAINIQIALWVYMSSFLGCIKRYLRHSFDFDAKNEDIGLKSGDFII